MRRDRESMMKPSPTYIYGDFEEYGSTLMIDFDGGESLEILGEGVEYNLSSSDFFNAFEDDFDDSDIY